MGPPDHPYKAQATPGRSGAEHITFVVAAGINTACTPPLVIYKGKSPQEQWFPEVGGKLHTAVTNLGWTNAFMTKQWLEKCFDPATRD